MPERLRKFDPAELDGEQQAIYDKFAGGERASLTRTIPLVDESGHLSGPPNAWLLSPALGDTFQALGLVIRSGLGLPPRAQEIAILVVAHRIRSPFERYAHESAALQVGLSAADVDALCSGHAVVFTDPQERTCYELTVAMMDTGVLSDAEYAQAVDVLGEKGLLELTAIIGWYQMIGLQLSVFQVLPPI